MTRRSLCVRDVSRQVLLFGLVYGVYQLVRGLVATSGALPFTNANRVISLERALGVFVEPGIQQWLQRHAGWLLEVAAWTYVNAQFTVVLAILVFVYLRRHEAFCRLRDTLLASMALALVAYAAFPAAPPRLMPHDGFTDPVARLTGITGAHSPAGLFVNAYAAIPSMHACFAVVIAASMSRLATRRLAKVVWWLYPVAITFVVIATANHLFTDVILGALTAVLAERLAAPLATRRARRRERLPAFTGAAA